MTLKAVLFDMDGVLYDSMPYHAQAWSQAVEQFGLHISLHDVYLNEGRTGRSTIDLLARSQWGRDATDAEATQIYAAKSALFATYPPPNPMPGAAEALRQIQQLGLEIVLVTGSALPGLEERLEGDFPGIFTRPRMITAFDVVHGKPHPEPYLLGLRAAGVEAAQALVVENAPLGVEAARAAGIYTIALNTGPLHPHELLQAGAQHVFARHEAFGQALQIIRERME